MEITLFIGFAIITILAWIVNRWKLRDSVKLAYKVPSNRWHTFFGCGKFLGQKAFLTTLNKFINKHGINSVYWLGPIPLFTTIDPVVLKDVLTSKNCIDKPTLLYEAVTIVAKEGLISANEPFWSTHRKVMNKAFSNKNLISFFPIFNKEIKTIIEEIRCDLENGEVIDMLLLFRELTIRNTTKTILKRDVGLTEYNLKVLAKHVHEILEYVAKLSVNPFLKVPWLRKIANITRFKSVFKGLTEFRKLIDESWDILKENDTTHPSSFSEINSVLDYALNGVNQNVIKEDETKGEMMHLFAGAFDTTSSTLYFLLCLLAMHPEYQQTVYEEVVSVLPDNDDDDITLEQVDQLTYLEMVLNETFRVLPVVPMVFREVSNEDLHLSNGLKLPVGQCVCIDIYSLHRSKEIWGPEADVFNPDNFLPANMAARHPFAFIPFTKGQRSCIGWKYGLLVIKISLAKLIKSYKFTTDFKYQDLRFENHVTLKLIEEPYLHLEPRKVKA